MNNSGLHTHCKLRKGSVTSQIVFPQNSYANPQVLRMHLYSEMGLLKRWLN